MRCLGGFEIVERAVVTQCRGISGRRRRRTLPHTKPTLLGACGEGARTAALFPAGAGNRAVLPFPIGSAHTRPIETQPLTATIVRTADQGAH